jgi:hypothetical protein
VIYRLDRWILLKTDRSRRVFRPDGEFDLTFGLPIRQENRPQADLDTETASDVGMR